MSQSERKQSEPYHEAGSAHVSNPSYTDNSITYEHSISVAFSFTLKPQRFPTPKQLHIKSPPAQAICCCSFSRVARRMRFKKRTIVSCMVMVIRAAFGEKCTEKGRMDGSRLDRAGWFFPFSKKGSFLVR